MTAVLSFASLLIKGLGFDDDDSGFALGGKSYWNEESLSAPSLPSSSSVEMKCSELRLSEATTA